MFRIRKLSDNILFRARAACYPARRGRIGGAVDGRDEFYTIKGYQRREESELTSAMEDYLEMIVRLAEKDGCAHVGELSRMLHVTPPSATKMVRQLAALGYIRAEKYGDIYLTEKGEDVGRYLLYRHGVICRFLQQLNNTKCELEQAEKIEHFIDRRTVKSLDLLTQRLKRESGADKAETNEQPHEDAQRLEKPPEKL